MMTWTLVQTSRDCIMWYHSKKHYWQFGNKLSPPEVGAGPLWSSWVPSETATLSSTMTDTRSAVYHTCVLLKYNINRSECRAVTHWSGWNPQVLPIFVSLKEQVASYDTSMPVAVGVVKTSEHLWCKQTETNLSQNFIFTFTVTCQPVGISWYFSVCACVLWGISCCNRIKIFLIKLWWLFMLWSTDWGMIGWRMLRSQLGWTLQLLETNWWTWSILSMWRVNFYLMEMKINDLFANKH